MIRMPPIRCNHTSWNLSTRPSAVAEAPNSMKMMVKPVMKRVACSSATRRRELISSSVRPVRHPMYEGTSGSTQGERKLSRPAVKATNTPSVVGSFIAEPPSRGAAESLRKILPLPITAYPVDLYSMPLMLELLLVGDDAQHSFQPLVGELIHPAAAHADQVFMVGLGRHGFVAPESLAEIMGPHQPALHQHFECAIDSGESYGLAAFGELALDLFDREVSTGEEDDFGDEVALPRHRMMMVFQIAAEA